MTSLHAISDRLCIIMRRGRNGTGNIEDDNILRRNTSNSEAVTGDRATNPSHSGKIDMRPHVRASHGAQCRLTALHAPVEGQAGRIPNVTVRRWSLAEDCRGPQYDPD